LRNAKNKSQIIVDFSAHDIEWLGLYAFLKGINPIWIFFFTYS
jgi:hypothetical protein